MKESGSWFKLCLGCHNASFRFCVSNRGRKCYSRCLPWQSINQKENRTWRHGMKWRQERTIRRRRRETDSRNLFSLPSPSSSWVFYESRDSNATSLSFPSPFPSCWDDIEDEERKYSNSFSLQAGRRCHCSYLAVHIRAKRWDVGMELRMKMIGVKWMTDRGGLTSSWDLSCCGESVNWSLRSWFS